MEQKPTIKQWVEAETNNFLNQVRPSSGEYDGIDRWMKYKDKLVEEITFLYNNSDCWNKIDEEHKHQIVNKILQELESDDTD